MAVARAAAGAALAALLLAAAAAAHAQPSPGRSVQGARDVLRGDSRGVDDRADCPVVLLRCDAAGAGGGAVAAQLERQRRDALSLGPVVVEGVAPARPTPEQAFARHLGAETTTMRTFDTRDGRRCTCVSPCWLNCCACTEAADAAPSAPGSLR